MPVNPYQTHEVGLKLLRNRHFVGRVQELEILHLFLKALRAGTASHQIVHVFGPAGNGKSSLLHELQTRGAADEAPLAALDIDSDLFDTTTSAPDLVWHLRFALRAAGVRTPLYDLYYATYFSRYKSPGGNITVPDFLTTVGARTEVADKTASVASSKSIAEKTAELFDADFMKDVATEVGKGIKGVQLATKLAALFKKKAKNRALLRQGIDLAQASVDTMLELAPEVLSTDLLGHVAHTGPLAIVIDGFDRVQSAPQALRAPSAAERCLEAVVRFTMFATPAELRKKIGFVFLGRERLRWAELFDRPATKDSWRAHVLEVPLQGFTRAEAEVLLKHTDFSLDQEGFAALAVAMRSSTAVALALARAHEDSVPGADSTADSPRYSPFRLRLCVEQILQTGVKLEPLKDGQDQVEGIISSFLRGVSDELRRVIHVFAVAGPVDEVLYQRLVRAQLIHGFGTAEYPLLTQREAIFSRSAVPGAYRLHYQLEAAALTMLTLNETSLQIGVAAFDAVFDSLSELATANAYAALLPAHVDAYSRCMALIFRVREAGLLPLERFALGFLQLEEKLHYDRELGGDRHETWVARLYMSVAHWGLEEVRGLVASQARTPEGARARAILKFMQNHFFKVAGQHQEVARTLFTRLYAAGILPPSDGEFAGVEELAWFEVQRAQNESDALADSNELDAAAERLEAAIADLPLELHRAADAEHRGDLSLALARIAVRRRDKMAAAARFEEAVRYWVEAGLAGRALAKRKLRVCEGLLMFVGDEARGYQLLKESAEVLEQELPKTHPTRGDLAACLAQLFIMQGMLPLALTYFRQARDTYCDNFGESDPRTRRYDDVINDIAGERRD